jgi:rhamnose utilization protein RhaD (predicted bifunctional aldolase and dehydrogenase)
LGFLPVLSFACFFTVDHTIKDQVDLSKNSGGTDSTTSTKNNIEEVDIAKLRELIHDDKQTNKQNCTIIFISTFQNGLF